VSFISSSLSAGCSRSSVHAASPGRRIAGGKGIDAGLFDLIQRLRRTPVTRKIAIAGSRGRNGGRDQRGEPDSIAFVKHGVGRDDAIAERGEALEGILGEYPMHYCNDGPGEALKRKLSGSVNQCLARGSYIISEYRLSATPF
jgi:hypothetical protein